MGQFVSSRHEQSVLIEHCRAMPQEIKSLSLYWINRVYLCEYMF